MFSLFSRRFLRKQNSIVTLTQAQFLNTGNKFLDGGWAYVTNASTFPTTVPTVWVLLLLLEEGINAQECLNKGINWLLENHPIEEKSYSGWGSTKFDEPRVYTTALALRILVKYKRTSTDQFIKAKNWLIDARDEEGRWGEKKGSPPTFLHTAHALITLRECGIESYSEILSKGCEWLLESYDSKNLWNNLERGGLVENMDITAPPGVEPSTQRITYFHFTIPWVVNALIVCGRLNTTELFRAINWTVENGRYGYWDHPFTVPWKNKPMWAIYDSLLALKNFQVFFPQWWGIEQIILKDGEITSKPIGKTGNSVVRYFKRFLKSKITWSCFGIILVALFLIYFEIISAREGILLILVPFLIAVIANLITKEAKDTKVNKKEV